MRNFLLGLMSAITLIAVISCNQTRPIGAPPTGGVPAGATTAPASPVAATFTPVPATATQTLAPIPPTQAANVSCADRLLIKVVNEFNGNVNLYGRDAVIQCYQDEVARVEGKPMSVSCGNVGFVQQDDTTTITSGLVRDVVCHLRLQGKPLMPPPPPTNTPTPNPTP